MELKEEIWILLLAPGLSATTGTRLRAVRGVHVGIAKNSEGWLCYIPTTNSTVISADVVFDEDFETNHARLETRNCFAGGIPLQPHPHDIPDFDQIEVVGFAPPSDQREDSERPQQRVFTTNRPPVYTDV